MPNYGRPISLSRYWQFDPCNYPRPVRPVMFISFVFMFPIFSMKSCEVDQYVFEGLAFKVIMRHDVRQTHCQLCLADCHQHHKCMLVGSPQHPSSDVPWWPSLEGIPPRRCSTIGLVDWLKRQMSTPSPSSFSSALGPWKAWGNESWRKPMQSVG